MLVFISVPPALGVTVLLVYWAELGHRVEEAERTKPSVKLNVSFARDIDGLPDLAVPKDSMITKHLLWYKIKTAIHQSSLFTNILTDLMSRSCGKRKKRKKAWKGQYTKKSILTDKQTKKVLSGYRHIKTETLPEPVVTKWRAVPF